MKLTTLVPGYKLTFLLLYT